MASKGIIHKNAASRQVEALARPRAPITRRPRTLTRAVPTARRRRSTDPHPFERPRRWRPRGRPARSSETSIAPIPELTEDLFRRRARVEHESATAGAPRRPDRPRSRWSSPVGAAWPGRRFPHVLDGHCFAPGVTGRSMCCDATSARRGRPAARVSRSISLSSQCVRGLTARVRRILDHPATIVARFVSSLNILLCLSSAPATSTGRLRLGS